MKGIHICLKEGPELLSKGDNSEIALTNENNSCKTALLIQYVKILILLKNHWSNFNQTWHKATLGGGRFKFGQQKAWSLYQGEIITKYPPEIHY